MQLQWQCLLVLVLCKVICGRKIQSETALTKYLLDNNASLQHKNCVWLCGNHTQCVNVLN